jgi:uncharacterized membrane protein
MVHAIAGIALFALALISIAFSILIAIKPAAQSAGQGLLKRANMVGLVEFMTVGIIVVTGVTAAFLKSLPFSQTWLWMGLMIMVFYAAALQFVTKPARRNVPEGSTAVKVGMQVALQVAHVLLLIVAFAVMKLKPI